MTPEIMDGIPRTKMYRAWQSTQGQRAWQFQKKLKPFRLMPRRGLIDWRRVGDFLSGFGLGLFVGAVGALIVIGQLAQWGGK